MHELYAKYTGKSVEAVAEAMDRDTWLDAEEAKEFGLVDKVFETRPTLPMQGSGGRQATA